MKLNEQSDLSVAWDCRTIENDVSLIFPKDPLVPKQADSIFLEEVEAAKELGIDYILIDHDQLLHEESFAISGIEEGCSYVYRGWM